MPFRPSMTTLRDVLVDIYPTDDDIRILLESVGVPTRRIKFTSVALNTWYFALSEADNQGMIGDIVKQARQDNPKIPICRKQTTMALSRELEASSSARPPGKAPLLTIRCSMRFSPAASPRFCRLSSWKPG